MQVHRSVHQNTEARPKPDQSLIKQRAMLRHRREQEKRAMRHYTSSPQVYSARKETGRVHYQLDGLPQSEKDRDDCIDVATTVLLKRVYPGLTLEQVSAALDRSSKREQHSAGDVASELVRRYSFPVVAEIFDGNLPMRSKQLQEATEQGLPEEVINWLAAHGETDFDSWQKFVRSGGRFDAPRRPSVNMLRRDLKHAGPLLLMRSMSTDAKSSQELHASVCAGYRPAKDLFEVIDSHPDENWETCHRLTASSELIGAAAVNGIDLLLTVNI